jgi:uncharacterized protein YejL (UPF0352 family)
MDSLAPHHTVVALTLDEPRVHTRRTRLVVLMGLGVMLLAFALMAASASAAQAFRLSGDVSAQAIGPGEEVSLHGVVLDSAGQPVSGAEVFAREDNPPGGTATTHTGADGSYSLQLAPGTYLVAVFDTSYPAPLAADAVVRSLVLKEETTENFSMPPVGSVTVNVVDANGAAAQGVVVEDANANSLSNSTGETEEGTPVEFNGYTTGGQPYDTSPGSCTTNASGQCSFAAVVGTVEFTVRPPGGLSVTTQAKVTVEGSVDTVKLAAVPVVLHGVVLDSAGQPVSGAEVFAREDNPPGGTATTHTGADGSYSLQLAPGTYLVAVFDTSYPAPLAADAVVRSLVLKEETTENFSMPPVGSVTVNVVDANGAAAQGVVVEDANANSLSNSTGETEEGTPVEFNGYTTGGQPYDTSPGSCTTNASGQCSFAAVVGTVEFTVRPPGGLSVTTQAKVTVEGDTDDVALRNYARVASLGSSVGVVDVASPPETTLSAVSDEQAKEAGLPEGAVAVVGSVSYTVSGLTPGGSVNVTMQLPPGSEPTNVFKLINGSYVDVTSLATISGNTITLHLTDGGLGDADGLANGVIVDPVVPVHITKHSQTIAFSSTAPSRPSVGSDYLPSAPATSGLPVSFSIDGSSTAGACSVSAGTVSFTGVGTCVIDANQVGNDTYLPAPQKQQTVEVVKASQTITFTTTAPSNPTVGSVYLVSAVASSGLPVSYLVDKASQKGACKISGTTVSFTGAGSCVIDANQSGDATHLAAPQVQQTIAVTAAQASTTTTMVLTAPSAVYGSEQADVAKIAITAAGGGTIPTGKIAVKTSTKTLCTATISNGTGSCMIGPKVLNPGVYPVVAVYTATTHFGASTSSSSTLTVTKDPTSTALSLSAASVKYGSEQTEIVNVTVTAGGGITPTGSVKIKAGTRAVCTATLNVGVGTCSPKATTLLRGNYNVEAVYAGSTTLEPSMSSSTSLTVS